jgi:Pentapeptide repeats (8 copies)
MANKEHLEVIKQGVDAWNKWRNEHAGTRPDLSRTDLSVANLSNAELSVANLIEANLIKANLNGAYLYEANLSGANLYEANLGGANLSGADLRRADLSEANLFRADLSEANLRGADLRRANLIGANLGGANLSGADLRRADLSEANLYEANLGGANLFQANLTDVRLVETNVENANLGQCRIHGISVWNLKGVPRDQLDLIITHDLEPIVTIDNVEIAQFIYLLLNNQKIRQVIDTITSKLVLILGRFTEERKRVLDAIREELRKHDYIPVLFDFEKPVSKDITGTVETLARMARFIIADLTDPSSIPHELGTIVPFLRTTPVLPIRVVSSQGYSMFEDLRRSYNWVLDTYEYANGDSLISNLPQVIAPADRMAEEFRRVR